MYMLQKTESLGMSPMQGAFLISIINAVNSVSRVLTGWVSGMQCANSIFISSVSMTVGGLATIACALFTTYPQLALYATVYGACIGQFSNNTVLLKIKDAGVEET